MSLWDQNYCKWFTAARAQGILISGETLKTKGEVLNQENYNVCVVRGRLNCSNGWLSCGTAQHNIRYRSICGENAAVNREVCSDNYKKKKKWNSYNSNFLIIQIFCLDFEIRIMRTTLYYTLVHVTIL